MVGIEQSAQPLEGWVAPYFCRLQPSFRLTEERRVPVKDGELVVFQMPIDYHTHHSVNTKYKISERVVYWQCKCKGGPHQARRGLPYIVLSVKPTKHLQECLLMWKEAVCKLLNNYVKTKGGLVCKYAFLCFLLLLFPIYLSDSLSATCYLSFLICPFFKICPGQRGPHWQLSHTTLLVLAYNSQNPQIPSSINTSCHLPCFFILFYLFIFI